ncbi:hypothetical protein D3C74_193760 [compost metagenome]
MADSRVFHWLAKSFSGLVNWRAYSTNTIIVPIVMEPRMAKIPPIPATIAKLRLFSPFISFGIKPEIVWAQKPDSRIRSLRSPKPWMTLFSCENALIICCPDSVSSMYPFSSPTFFWRSLYKGPVRRVIQRIPAAINGTTIKVSRVISGLNHSITVSVPISVNMLEKI